MPLGVKMKEFELNKEQIIELAKLIVEQKNKKAGRNCHTLIPQVLNLEFYHRLIVILTSTVNGKKLNFQCTLDIEKRPDFSRNIFFRPSFQNGAADKENIDELFIRFMYSIFGDEYLEALEQHDVQEFTELENSNTKQNKQIYDEYKKQKAEIDSYYITQTQELVVKQKQHKKLIEELKSHTDNAGV